MDYERSNAQEWAMDGGPNLGISEHEDLNDDLIDYAQSQYDEHEASPEDPDSGWQQVSHKKLPSKTSTPPKMSTPMKNSASRLSSRPKPLPPQTIRSSPLKGPRLPQQVPQQTQAPFPRPAPVQALRPSQPLSHSLPLRPKSHLTFSTKNDNPAKAAFRAQKPPTSFIELSEPCSYIEPDRTRMYEILEEMGVRLGSFIRPPQHLKDTKLLLWGDATQVERTKKDLHEWIRLSQIEPPTSRKTDHFARSGVITEEKAKAVDKKLKRDSVRQKFQRAPECSLNFRYTGGFLWPVDEVRPEDLLGPSFEAFDPLRMAYQAYITFDHRLGFFDIKSDSESAVSHVMRRIIGTMKEYAARNCREIMVLMVEPPEPKQMCKEVKTVAVPALSHGPGTAYMPLLTGPKLSEDEMVQWEEKCNTTSEEQFLQMGGIIRKVLSYLPFYRGRIQMRVLLGTFVLTTFRRWGEGVSSVPFEKFLADMKMSATKGKMIKEYVSFSVFSFRIDRNIC